MSVCYYVLFWNIDFPPGSIARHFYAPLKTFNQCRMRKTMTVICLKAACLHIVTFLLILPMLMSY